MKNIQKYFHISESEKKWGFYVTTIGYNKVRKNEQYPPNKVHPADHCFTWNKGRILDGYYMVYISNGQGIFESAQTKPFNVKAGHCFLLFPGVWHRYKPDPNQGWEEYWIGFNGTYPDIFMKKGFFNPKYPFINAGLNEKLLLLLQELIQTGTNTSIGYPQILSGITLQILGLINAINLQGEKNADPVDKLISKAKFRLQSSLENQVNMEDLVEEFPVSYSKFRKVFRAKVGLSPNQYHLELRLKKAKELLDSTTLSISEIAYKTGFESVFYFSRIFKNKNGKSPKLYRVNK